MAKPITYDPPPPPPIDTAADELADLLQTLHESGTLRALNGLFGQFEQVSEVIAKGLDSEGGRNGLSNLFQLVKFLGELDADHVEVFLKGTEKGLAAGRARLQHGEAPSLLGLFTLLRDEDTRRGLAAVLTLLQSLGEHMKRNKPLLPGEK